MPNLDSPIDISPPSSVGADAVPRVVVVGGGFAGLQAARSLAGTKVRVTLVDRRNFHLFQPLLYQVATGELSPANIATPLRGILRKQRNASVLLQWGWTFLTHDRSARLITDGPAVDIPTMERATGWDDDPVITPQDRN